MADDVEWASAPADADLTVHLLAWRDFSLARLCLAALRRSWPGARVQLVTDGDPDPRFDGLAARFGVELVRGERLYLLQHRGAIAERMLTLWARRPTPWLLRIDTDTLVRRRFTRLPLGAAAFGTLERRTQTHREPLDPPLVHGGCLGLTAVAAERLLASGVFRSPALADPLATWADCRDPRERARGGRVSFDFLVRWGCREAALPAVSHPEVRSIWRGLVLDPRGRYAVTHPHKLLRQWPRLLAALALSRLRERR